MPRCDALPNRDLQSGRRDADDVGIARDHFMLGFASSIAKLTAHRNRGALDRAALELVAACAPQASVELFRCVGPAQQPRLLLAARAQEGIASSVPQPWVTLDSLPEVNSVPIYVEALRDCRPVHEDAGRRQVFPIDANNQGLALVDLRSPDPIERAQSELIQTLLEIYRNQVTLLDYGETDSLTGLLNRKTYDTTFYEAATRSRDDERTPEPDRRAPALQRWLAVVDIDHFKRVNDQHGHLIGDEMLLLVSGLMRSTFRFGDALYRFGGEEFVILLRAPERQHARAAFERLRSSLRNFDFPQVGNITASIGFTQIRDLDSPSAAFERADRAVYFAKQNGRDQVRCFEDLVDEGALEAPDRAGAVELF
jgi:diguanylate cyclase (GGDEF)-like protein